MKSLPFHKLDGLANDFVLIDAFKNPAIARKVTKSVIHALADRKRGVGYDQLLLLKKPSASDKKKYDIQLEIYNADASRAEMCGNGLRAASYYLWKHKIFTGKQIQFKTDAGPRLARLIKPVHKPNAIECEMGIPRILPTPQLLLKALSPICVDVGNPHAVLFAMPQNTQQLAEWGAKIENHKAFPNRTNVEFVKIRGSHSVDAQVWERGVGITEACGTGGVAAACAAIHCGFVRSPVEVRFPGGTLSVRWDDPQSSAFLVGDVHESFSGEWIL